MAKGDKKNIVLERRKPKKQQKENLTAVDGRDTFQTPNYAVDLLIPHLTWLSHPNFRIWECASGQGKIVDRLEENGFSVFGTDLQHTPSVNFLYDVAPMKFDCIVTNPPFSLKRKFYFKCLDYQKPFALLIPADYSGWLIDAVNRDGCEKIIPTRRIDYITPNGNSGKSSASQFHSMWLTWGFNLGKSETFVELPIEWKKKRI